MTSQQGQHLPYMTCRLSYILQGRPLCFRQISFHMRQVSTSELVTRVLYSVLNILQIIRACKWNRQQWPCGGIESISVAKVYFQIEKRVPSWKWHGKWTTKLHLISECVIVCPYLSSFFQITVDCIEGYPSISLQLGKHIFLSAGEFYFATQSWFLSAAA
jgi:hypothetical protein